MTSILHETAYAKINLALHVRRRRDDGYHELETLFAFVDRGDELSFRPDEQKEFAISGPFAAELQDDSNNLVLRAMDWLCQRHALVATGALTLDKYLPVAAGLGGGSADAAAALRLLARASDITLDEATIRDAVGLGADVPACIVSETRIGRGVGEKLEEPADNDWRGMPVLLVNPAVPLATGPVFAGWDGVDRGALTGGSVSEMALSGRNDLEKPAVQICPAITGVLELFAAQRPLLARMSGSGATCFAIFDDVEACAEAQKTIERAKPRWWTITGRLR